MTLLSSIHASTQQDLSKETLAVPGLDLLEINLIRELNHYFSGRTPHSLVGKWRENAVSIITRMTARPELPGHHKGQLEAAAVAADTKEIFRGHKIAAEVAKELREIEASHPQDLEQILFAAISRSRT